MLRRALSLESADVALDLCRPCQLVWFDPGELERLPGVPPKPAATELSQPARESLAMLRVDLDREQRELESHTDPPDATWKQVVGVFGLPVEAEASDSSSRPWATWALALAIAVASAWALLAGGENVLERFGFVAAAPRWSTLATHAFLHGGIGRLVLNVYFLLLVGDDVEELAGRAGFVVLFALAVLGGAFAHFAWTVTPDVALLGANGGIAGLVAYHALRRPRAQLALFWPVGWGHSASWIRMPLWVWAGLWLAADGIGRGRLRMFSTGSRVSYEALLGGALVGVLAWGAWKLAATRSTPSRRL